MHPMVRKELSRIDPDVPFRARSSYHHHTWAKTYYSRPELYIQPETTEEIQKIITLARRCRRRLTTVGCGHSPSDLTCTSSWMVNLDRYNRILSVDERSRVVVMQAGIRLEDLQLALKDHGLALPNTGSINSQSIAGAIATATHGSSLQHGLLSEEVLGLRIVLSNGQIVTCSKDQNQDLFRAALVSLGALGVIIEVTFQAVPEFKIAWEQKIVTLNEIVQEWNRGLWTSTEFTRVWWMPYQKKCVKWTAEKTDQGIKRPKPSWVNGRLGFYVYHNLLYLCQWIPFLLPSLEKLAIAVQYGDSIASGVEEGRTGLLMNCLYSQFVNEWAIPLEKGPEALTRLSAWLNGDREGSQIPFDIRGMYVHSPIEVRVSDTTRQETRAYLDNTVSDGPTLYLNATLYRPYNRDPPCHLRYYEAFEWLMKEMGGRPHWAKNFYDVNGTDFHAMYPDMSEFMRVREEVDPEGMFFGDWHRRNLLPAGSGKLFMPLEERQVKVKARSGGGKEWYGEMTAKTLSPQNSEESFDLMQDSEAEKSILLEQEYSSDD